jgi:hypothetical protein
MSTPASIQEPSGKPAASGTGTKRSTLKSNTSGLNVVREGAWSQLFQKGFTRHTQDAIHQSPFLPAIEKDPSSLWISQQNMQTQLSF